MMQNRIRATWNSSTVIDAQSTHVMILQIAEMLAKEFVGETQRDAMRDIWVADLLNSDLNKPLPRIRWIWGDDTGTCTIDIN